MKKIFSLLTLSSMLSPLKTFAKTATPPEPVRLTNPLGDITDIPSLAHQLIIAVLGIVGVIALMAFIWGGLLWMTSAGNADRVKQGKETLIYATLGLLVIFISYSVVNFVISSLTTR